MIEFPFQTALSPGLSLRPIPEKSPPVVPSKRGNASGKAGSQYADRRAQFAPTKLQLRLARHRTGDRLVGPPPSFQANVLEVRSDIKYAIQQFENEREKLRNGDAATVKKPPPEPPENSLISSPPAPPRQDASPPESTPAPDTGKGRSD